MEKKIERSAISNIDEKRRIKNEKRRLWRMKKKAEKSKNALSSNHDIAWKSNVKEGMENFANPLLKGQFININLVLPEDRSENIPLVPTIPLEIQQKISTESQKMDLALKGKLNLPRNLNKENDVFHLKSNGNGNFILDSFFNQKATQGTSQAKSQQAQMTEVIDLTSENEAPAITTGKVQPKLNEMADIFIDLSTNREEYLNKVILSINKNANSIDTLNSLANTNPSLYSEVSSRYWNYVIAKGNQRSNIKFPIDDKELYANPDLYSLSSEFLSKPTGCKPFIPNEMINTVIKIWDFIHTFKHKLLISEFTPEQLFSALTHYQDDEIVLVSEIHIALLYIMMSVIQEKEYVDLQTEGELMMIKLIIENTSIKHFLKKTWPEVMRLAIGSRIFHFFANHHIKEISKKLKSVDIRSYNLLSLEEKLMLLDYLVNSCVDTNFIRDTIKEELDKRNEIRKNKRDIEEELRVTDSRKRELERQEKFTQPRLKVESLTKRLSTLNEDNPDMTRQELSKLRKEIEGEREQFKSVIKEIESIESRRMDILTKIEKLSNEIFDIPTVNKKHLGTDGFGNEYYFFPPLNSKLYMKRIINEKVKQYEWREFVIEEEIMELLSKLSEKGIKELNLRNKITKLLHKRLKIKKSSVVELNNEASMIVDMNDINKQKENEFLMSALEWRNKIFGQKKYEKDVTMIIDESDRDALLFNEIEQMIKSIEERMSEYLSNDNKEWESFDIRANLKAWLGFIRKIPEYAKVLILFNERIKAPYKINDFGGSLIIHDDEYEGQFTIFDMNNNLDPTRINPKRTQAPKAKLWSKEFEQLALEDIFVEYLYTVESFPSMFLSINVFDAVLNDLIKRRESYKKKSDEGGNVLPFGKEEIKFDEREKEEKMCKIPSEKNSSTEENYNNNISTKPNNAKKKSKIITDDFDDFVYDEKLFEESYNFNCDFPSARTRSSRKIQNTNINANSSQPKKEQKKVNKKNIEWNETCHYCGDFGDLICCEDCPNVTHLFCIGLKKIPDVWRCEDCNFRLANRRITRSSKYQQ